MIRQSALRAVVLIAFGGVVAGCSETGFQDFIGAGKYAPDETQVAVNQPLSVPPDLQLRPPSDEPQQVASAPQPSQQPASGDLQQPQDLGLWLWLAQARRAVAAVALGLVIGGALGNTMDRVVHGAVADFFLVHGFGFSWYVFNIADSAIVAGVVLLLYESLSEGKHG